MYRPYIAYVCTVIFWLIQLKVQSYSPGGANVLTQVICCFWSPHMSAL